MTVEDLLNELAELPLTAEVRIPPGDYDNPKGHLVTIVTYEDNVVWIDSSEE
jgi:hypothetical protein